MELFTALISALTLATYLVAMGFLYGMREYVSDNFYIGKHKWLFSAVMLVVAVCLLPAMVAKSEQGVISLLPLLAVWGLMTVAIAPHYKANKMHAIGAFEALICGVVWVALFHPFIVLAALVLWLLYKWAGFAKPYYIGEVTAFGLIYYTLLA
mgnify:FL=1|jgi:hypothetical protein|nr:MAG TPA: hypothetical protein [Caudoviricetes sp.]